MSYQEALEAAGAEVLAFAEFGSYQGDWLAHVRYKDETLVIHGYYGSCSGCDAFQGEFGWSDEEGCEQHCWKPKEDCSECAETRATYQEKLANFGRKYLEDPADKDALIEEYTKQAEWDSDAPEMVTWLRGLS